MKPPEKRKVGRPPADEVDRLRSRVWYLAVKSRGQWSDYKLDIEFARKIGEMPRSGMDRRRAFEELRRTGRVPTEGTHWRREFDLVRNVEAHPDFKGTADYFYSAFWTLLKPVPMQLPVVKQMVDSELKRADLYRPSDKMSVMLEILGNSGKSFPQISCEDKYRVFLENRLQSLPFDLNIFALLGSLFREAYLGGALEIAVILKNLFIEKLEEFCVQPWLEPEDTGGRLLRLSERRVFHMLSEDEECLTLGYDSWPIAVVRRPLYPLNEATRYVIEHEEELGRDLMKWMSDSLASKQST